MDLDSEFKHGWPALLGGMFGNFSGIGGLLYFALSSFMKPLQNQFGWSRVMSSRYFGLARQGLVFGAGMSVVSLGAMLSPAVIGGLYHQYGNYDRALQLTMLLCVAGASTILTLAPPTRFEAAPIDGCRGKGDLQ